ncbi:hypothetical protein HORIV_73450 [Vreelandella olivaria]|uniref:MnmG N-terminal domain-containing protein n=1 Tax=Vreelandella olivaria TaxID=390919 RepID=A0ABM7GVU5_9GAMM|nr:hypothetical protein HORIV_73450 [Halomonas olivaria]
MGLATDLGGIQFRVLNARKGPAVRATRAQADRIRYKAAIRGMLENQPNLTIFQQAAGDLIVDNDTVRGVVTETRYSLSCRQRRAVYRHVFGWRDSHWSGSKQGGARR